MHPGLVQKGADDVFARCRESRDHVDLGPTCYNKWQSMAILARPQASNTMSPNGLLEPQRGGAWDISHFRCRWTHRRKPYPVHSNVSSLAKPCLISLNLTSLSPVQSQRGRVSRPFPSAALFVNGRDEKKSSLRITPLFLLRVVGASKARLRR